MRRALLLCAALAAFGAWAQTMYKWVDEKGVTHFSETPPPDGKAAATKIQVKPVGEAAPRADNWRERELESRQRRAKEGVAEENARRQDEANRARRCRNAQSQVDGIRNSARVFQLDAKGERVYLDDTQRAAELKRWQEEVDKYCS